MHAAKVMSRSRRIAGNVYRRADSPVLWLWYWDRDGRRRHRASSADETVARRELAAILERVRQGEDAIADSGELTIAAWGARWVSLRREAGKGEADNEAAHLEHHIAPAIGRIRLRDLSTAHVLDFVRRLPAQLVATGSGARLAPATCHKIAGTLRSLCREAAKRGLIQTSPCDWDHGDLPELGAPAIGEGFEVDEVLQLITDERVPEDRRVLYALEFLTGMRTGEAAMRRWRDWDRAKTPLTALRVETSWSTRRRVEKETKTRVRRTIPVHPALAGILDGWWGSGWPQMFGRSPGAEDLIVPGPDGAPRANNDSWRLFQADLEALGLRAQRHYETRSTFISLAEGGGADSGSIAILTHPSPRTAKDLYRRLRLLWPQLCRAVGAIALELPGSSW